MWVHRRKCKGILTQQSNDIIIVTKYKFAWLDFALLYVLQHIEKSQKIMDLLFWSTIIVL